MTSVVKLKYNQTARNGQASSGRPRHGPAAAVRLLLRFNVEETVKTVKTAKNLERPVLAVDAVVFTLHLGTLSVLLHHRRMAPFAGAASLPGVAVQRDETLLQAARRALAENAGLRGEEIASLHLEQLATFDGLYRDPRGRTVTVAYLGLLGGAVEERSPALWRPVDELAPGGLPFDHHAIVTAALERLRGKLRYTNIAAALLPPVFRIDELREVYEAILGRTLNRSNFRTLLLRIGLVETVGVDTAGPRGGRPPHLFRFRTAGPAAQEHDFI